MLGDIRIRHENGIYINKVDPFVAGAVLGKYRFASSGLRAS